MAKIVKIIARQILDGSGTPTLSAKIFLDNNIEVTTSIPSDWHLKNNLVTELRDNDDKNFLGQSVSKAVDLINNIISKKLAGVSPERQFEVDEWLNQADGTDTKERLGVNTILTISQLVFKAGAMSENIPFYRYINSLYQRLYTEQIPIDRIPTPIYTLIKGKSKEESLLDFDKFMIVPSSAMPFSQTVHMIFNICHKFHSDYSVFNLSTNLDALDALRDSFSFYKYKFGQDLFFGLDIKASNLYQNNFYRLKDKPQPLRQEAYFDYIKKMTERFSFILLIDPIANDDYQSWTSFINTLPKEIYVVANDLTMSNYSKIKNAIKDKTLSSFTIKIHQVGTIKGVLELVNLARTNNISYIFASSSNETSDHILADIAVGLQSDFLSFGPIKGGEYIAKYNRLLQVETEIST